MFLNVGAADANFSNGKRQQGESLIHNRVCRWALCVETLSLYPIDTAKGVYHVCKMGHHRLQHVLGRDMTS